MQRLIEDNEAEVRIELSQGKIRFTIGNVVLTSKLIDGTFPDYGRVIPQNTVNIDALNVNYSGRLGTGRIDLSQAVSGPAIAPPPTIPPPPPLTIP